MYRIPAAGEMRSLRPTRSGLHGSERQEPAGPATCRLGQTEALPARAQLLRDLLARNEHAAAVLAYQQSGDDELVHGRSQGGP